MATAYLLGSAIKQTRLIVLVLLVTIATFSQSEAPVAEVKTAPPPDLNLVLQSIERVEQQNPALSRAHEVTRRYKAFYGDDTQPSAEITARMSFTPPDRSTFQIIQASGNPRGEKIVRDILEQETAPATAGHNGAINRTNYDFVFLRQENFGLIPEYVFRIVPKRKEKRLILGHIWVDEKTFRIRRIEGVPVKSPSLWIKDIHLTLQYADVNGMWMPVSLDAIATVRILGRYTLTGVYVEAPEPPSVTPHP
ncbi:MAG TPA: hypothetical protein VKX49_00200 [Bryobacteraceae bacterium]|nr:hypothetical protein [Bryobacteraceae bacterium]